MRAIIRDMKVPEPQPEFPAREEQILSFWHENDVVSEYLSKNSNSEKNFRFLDGPITANNPMGVHHAHGRTIKDFFQRYKNSKGYKQRFQNGFDCQGLWVEVEEEKDLAFNSKHEIEEYGLEKFCNSCRNRVERFSKVQEEQSKRLGMFMDWDNSYYTMSENNNVHIWYFLKKVEERGWLYKGIDAMPWCTRCGTAISQHELSDGGYKTVKHTSVYLRFRLSGGVTKILADKFNLSNDHVSLLVWTTTPWTLLSNYAVALSPSLPYVMVKQGNEHFVVAQERIAVIESKGEYLVTGEFTGQEFYDIIAQLGTDGGSYESPFGFVKSDNRVILWSEVSGEDGTGFVHIAPSAGKEDFELSKTEGLSDRSQQSSIDEFGVYVDGYGKYTGKSVFEVREEIFADLKEDGLFYKFEDITHSYPHCWRCKHELVFRTTSEWFIKADEIRPKMKEIAKTVNWIPDHAGLRMQDWLDNMGDWPISRKRYWGLALPFFESEDGDECYVVGSKEELRRLAVDPQKVDSLQDLHRPWIDEIKITSPVSGDILTRVKDVGDCWLDAGIVPFSTVDYLSNRENWEQWYPFDFITEYVAQVKLWFYATLFMSVTLENQAPWKNVLTTGFLVDEKGDAMHKSAGNAIAFDEAARKAGSDAIRWLYLRDRVANHHGTGNLRFGYTILDEVRRRFLVIVWNTYRFFIQNALMDGWVPSPDYKDFESTHVLDKWLMSRYTRVLGEAEAHLELFDTPSAAGLIEKFLVEDVSQWYIRRSRDRVGPSAEDETDKNQFYATGYNVLHEMLQVLAPFIPFMAESLFQDLRNEKDPLSVHLTDWPTKRQEFYNATLENEMETARSIVEQTHAARKTEGLKVRQPLSEVVVYTTKNKLSDEVGEIITAEVNVKSISYVNVDDISKERVELNTTLRDELIAEGNVREFIRGVQNLRKEKGYELNQEIALTVSANENITSQLESFRAEITRKLLAQDMVLEPTVRSDVTGTIEINGSTVTVSLSAV